jgi:hypothetical protein
MSNQNPYQGIPNSSQNPLDAHDLRGAIDFSAGQLNFIRAIFYTVLGWASIGIETFLRKNFGERYYTLLNFFVGYLFLSWMMFTSSLFNAIQGGFMPDVTTEDKVWLPFVISFLYLCVGAYHFWMMWVKRQMVRHEYSYHDGDSHLVGLGEVIMRILNPLIIAVAKLLASLTVSRKDRKLLSMNLDFLPPLYDPDEFTKKWVEPVFVVLIGLIPGIPFFWALIAAVAVAVHSRMSYLALRKLQLDSRDAKIKKNSVKYDRVGVMGELRAELARRLVNRGPNITPTTKAEIVEEIKAENPDLNAALEELNIDLTSGMGKNIKTDTV